jgi:hypothetical protein
MKTMKSLFSATHDAQTLHVGPTQGIITILGVDPWKDMKVDYLRRLMSRFSKPPGKANKKEMLTMLSTPLLQMKQQLMAR